MSEEVYLRIHKDEAVCLIGSWTLPDDEELNNNFSAQSDIGWHIMMALGHQGADRVEVVVGELQNDAQLRGPS